MAIDQDTPPASSGKADEVEHLILAGITTVDRIAACLKRLQDLPDKQALEEEIPLLQGFALEIDDAGSCLDTIWESLER